MVKSLNDLFIKLRCSQKGASLVEYALLVALVAVMGVGSVRAVGFKISDSLEQVAVAVETGDSVGAGGGAP